MSKEMTVREAQEKWMKLLETGDYPQTLNGHLKDVDGFCCLGVAAEHVFDYPKTTKNEKCGYLFEFEDGGSYSLFSDFEKLGLYGSQGFVGNTDYRPDISKYIMEEFGISVVGLNLARLNDEGVSFKQIAQLIRKFPKAYFKKGYGYD